MRIESVTAVAFGPLRNVTREFAPQLTVIYGPNEAGKSSWHAAIYAALCGMRRARGPATSEDRDFTDLHRPWSGDSWEVQAFVRLDGGRRVELRQNLSDLAHCSATDADFGRDVSGEILNEGTPDAAKWLGLDRKSFLSVACVRQAEVQRVVAHPTSLQEALQRSAASAARDATAAQAIARMVDFQRENVGQDRAHNTKPLSRAKMRLVAAETALASAREKHANWLTIEAQALTLMKNANEEERRQRMLHALRARKDAEGWRAKVERARELTAKYPGGQPGPLPDDETLAGDVAAALSEWEHRPEVPVLAGESAASIRAEIDALPLMPLGDQVPATEIVDARIAYERGTQAFDLHEGQRPPEIQVSDAKGLTADQLRELARALDTPIPSLDSHREADYAEAGSRLAAAEGSSSGRPLVAGLAVAAVLGGAGLWAFGNSLIGSALVIAGAAALVWLVFRSGDARRRRALEEVRAVEAQVLSQRQAVADATEKVKAARAQIAKLALPEDSRRLRGVADELVLAEGHRQNVAEWSKSHELLRSQVNASSQVLGQALRQRGVAQFTDPLEGYREYARACQLRAEQAARAGKRQPLERQLADREAAEQAAHDAEARRSRARQRILDTTRRCGQGAHDVDLAIAELQRWQAARKEILITFDAASREYAELNALLAGGRLEELERQNVERQRQSATLAAEFDALPEIDAGVDFDDAVRRCETAAHDASHAATAAEAQARERARDVPSVAEAEEALASAQEESERVAGLSRALTLALEFLRTAEERVHRDIAPTLAAALRRWLPDVTQGRYTDARVDPSNLNVQVLGPYHEWRDAQRLSHGTAEQIYLLLRVVLAERLATTGETCPLILDDVLVQCDRVRKRALLDVISAISRTRQVILLSQEEEVLQWAQQNLVEPDRLVVLPGVA